jgi:hypothetical protein
MMTMTSRKAFSSFEFKLVDDAAGTFAARHWMDQGSAFRRNLAYAGAQVGAAVLGGFRFQVRVRPAQELRAVGAIANWGCAVKYIENWSTLYDVAAQSRAAKQSCPNEEDWDLEILVNPGEVDKTEFIDPDPGGETREFEGRTYFISSIMHELIHGLGAWGSLELCPSPEDEDCRQRYGRPGVDATLYDYLIKFHDNSPLGPKLEPNPAAIPLWDPNWQTRGFMSVATFGFEDHRFSQNFYHLGRCQVSSSQFHPWLVDYSLMTACDQSTGVPLYLTTYDIAILDTLGYQVTGFGAGVDQ